MDKACDVPVGAEITLQSSEQEPSTPPPPASQQNLAPPAALINENFVMIEEQDLKKLLVDQLKKELKKRNFATSGLKAELQARLRKAMEDRIPVLPEQTSEAPTQTEVFSTGARWEKLTFATQARIDPLENYLHEPTMSQELRDLEHTNVAKFDFVETFDRPPFLGLKEVDKLDRFKRRKFNPETKMPETERVPRNKGGPKSSFLREHNLDHTSMPHEWFEAFLPFSLITQWATFTNIKASFQNAGEEGGPYTGEYKPFSPREIQQHLAVYILQGLSPSPKLLSSSNHKERTT